VARVGTCGACGERMWCVCRMCRKCLLVSPAAYKVVLLCLLHYLTNNFQFPQNGTEPTMQIMSMDTNTCSDCGPVAHDDLLAPSLWPAAAAAGD
jgi:hypothetical protein